ncbi:PID-CTERM protein-sorting domain-containing protein [Hymenobacter sp. IS2118]|uniref:PID-CTERM protein-sorting domain-containing protein n=1 Tax=Hymenobacter sp. IS2118 TaxID=1505605 RepID=UPI0039776D4B
MNEFSVPPACFRPRAGGTNWRVARLFIALSLLAVSTVAAQPDQGGPQGPAAVPIDAGVSLLLLGGVGYAVRRLRQARRR